MKNKTVLLACPVSDYKAYIIEKWIKHVKQLQGNFDILLVDNSKGITFSRHLKRLGVQVIHTEPRKGEDLRRVMARCNNIINDVVAKHKYDYLFSVECDIFPPVDSLISLMAHDVPVISAVYDIGLMNENRTLMLQKFEHISGSTYEIRNVSALEGFDCINGQIHKVLAAGMGCLLIKTEILNGYTWHVEGDNGVHADSYFSVDMFDRGIDILLDTSIICKHFNSDWSKILRNYETRF